METVADLIERNESFYPNKEALIYQDRRYTYRDRASRARRLADGLYRLGARRQDRIAILSMNCAEYFDVYTAGEIAGYITTPINFRLAAPEIAYMLHDAKPRVLVFEAQYAEMVGKLRSQFPEIEGYVCIGEGPSWAVGFDAVLESGSEAGPPIRPRGEDYAYLFYTSGTTGRPKGVVYTHRSVFEVGIFSVVSSQFTVDSRILISTPLFHVGGKGYEWGGAAIAATVVMLRSFEPVAVLQTIRRERITYMFLVGAMLQAILDVPDVKSYDISSMRNIVTAAAPIPVPLLKRGIEVLGPVFSVQYGSTEGGTVCVLHKSEVNPVGTPDEIRRLASVGHSAPHVQLQILNEQDEICPTGVVGEVCIKSTARMAAYWNNDAATIETLRNGWLHTGDVGYRDEEGYVFLVDRKKDMIISGGENIYSREVEEALVLHPAVMEAAVIGVPDPKWGEAVKAVVVYRAGMKVSEGDLIAHCKSQLASYKCPKLIEFVHELPRVASGKVNKAALRQPKTPLPAN